MSREQFLSLLAARVEKYRDWPPPMSIEDLRAFVLGYCDGRVFTMHDVKNENDLPLVFMPVALGCFADVPPDAMARLGTIWERIDRADPRAVNGMPMFTSLHAMRDDDWKRAARAIDAELARRKTISLDL
jgi:hypothetical protein